MHRKHLTQFLLGSVPIDVRDVDLPPLVKRTATVFLDSRVRNLRNELQLAVHWLAVLLCSSFCLIGGFELHIAEPSMGIVFEGRKANIDDFAVLEDR